MYLSFLVWYSVPTIWSYSLSIHPIFALLFLNSVVPELELRLESTDKSERGTIYILSPWKGMQIARMWRYRRYFRVGPIRSSNRTCIKCLNKCMLKTPCDSESQTQSYGKTLKEYSQLKGTFIIHINSHYTTAPFRMTLALLVRASCYCFCM